MQIGNLKALSVFGVKKDQLAAEIFGYIRNVYYKRWQIDKVKHPIESNGIFVTFRLRNANKPFEPWMTRYADFNGRLLKQLIHEFGDETYVYSRQQVGMYAVDYEGSKFGYVHENMGPHVHSVFVMHPDLRDATLRNLQNLREIIGDPFFYKRITDGKYDLQTSISYSLKGIMHENGFYQDRSDKYQTIGPQRDKVESKVVRRRVKIKHFRKGGLKYRHKFMLAEA